MLGTKKVLTNWLFMCITMAFVCYNASGSTYPFIPKYMETQLGMHNAQASYLLGLVFLPSALFGLFASVAILRRFQLGPRGCLYLTTGASVLSLVILVPAGFISCPRPPIAGVNIPYGHSLTANVSLGRLPGGIALTSPCNADCGCPLDRYRPVCASDGITYFSGCHAGCRESQSIQGPRGIKLANYSNCGCVTSNPQSITGGSTKQLSGTQTIMAAKEESTGYFASVWATPNPENFTPDGVTDAANRTDTRTVTVTSEPNAYTNPSSSVQITPSTSAFSIPCPTKCIASRSFLALMTLNLVCRAMIPLLLVVASLRVLSPDTKTFGVGLQSLTTRLLAYIPAPIYIGALIDSSCELWSSSCGVRGACLLYNMPLNRLLFVGVQALLTSASIILMCVAIHLYNRREAAEGKSQAPGLTTRDIATSMGSLTSSIPSLTNVGVRNRNGYM
ncbi:solute carrier organic anion transporter family member 5A1-like [Branchiostoma floridae x Branchiostoma japonicum]